MRTLRLAACAFAFAAFVPFAFSQNTQNQNTQNQGGAKSAEGGAKSAEGGAQGSGEKIDDAKFVMKASQSDLAEIQMSKLAEQNAQSPAVKEFARKMVEDHTKSSQELMQIVQKSGHTPAKEIGEEHQQMATKLKDMKGQDFDRQYMMGQLKAHKMAIQLFQSAAQNAQDQQIKAFATKTLPVIQHHAQMAQQIAGKVGVQGAGQGQVGGQGGLIQPNQPNQPQIQPKQPIRPNQPNQQ